MASSVAPRDIFNTWNYQNCSWQKEADPLYAQFMSSADIHTMHLTKLLNIKEISLKNRELKFGILKCVIKKSKEKNAHHIMN